VSANVVRASRLNQPVGVGTGCGGAVGGGELSSPHEAIVNASPNTAVAIAVNRIRCRANMVIPSRPIVAQTATPNSLNASFRLVFVSVLALRWPMTSAHGTPYLPAGNALGRWPGMTTLFGGTKPLDSIGFSPVTSTMTVLAVSTTPAPSTAPAPT